VLLQNLVTVLSTTLMIFGPTVNYHHSIGLEISSLGIPLTSGISKEFVKDLKDREEHAVQKSIYSLNPLARERVMYTYTFSQVFHYL
jgi:hypothetical protein